MRTIGINYIQFEREEGPESDIKFLLAPQILIDSTCNPFGYVKQFTGELDIYRSKSISHITQEEEVIAWSNLEIFLLEELNQFK